jgi:GH18 family chitinase
LTYADFVNVMTYDLHGTWDGTDPWIGNVVLAHTNLTEIKTTLQLFQNVFTSPAQWKQVKISMRLDAPLVIRINFSYRSI